MSDTAELWHQIQQHDTHAPRDLLVAYVQALAARAKQLPTTEREARGDYTIPGVKFPQTPGEVIASAITTSLVMQDWIDHVTADDLEEIGEISGALEVTPNDSKLWDELFEKVDKLV